MILSKTTRKNAENFVTKWPEQFQIQLTVSPHRWEFQTHFHFLHSRSLQNSTPLETRASIDYENLHNELNKCTIYDVCIIYAPLVFCENAYRAYTKLHSIKFQWIFSLVLRHEFFIRPVAICLILTSSSNMRRRKSEPLRCNLCLLWAVGKASCVCATPSESLTLEQF